MSTQVRARLIDGQACLQLLDCGSSSVRMAWKMPSSAADYDPLEARNFFRELMLCDFGELLKERQQQGLKRIVVKNQDSNLV